MEGDNNQLFALLRELRPEDVGVHCLTDIRRPTGLRRRLTRADFKAPVAAAIAAGGGSSAAAAFKRPFPQLPGTTATASASAAAAAAGSSDPGAAPGAAAATTPSSPEQQLVGRIQELELFIKFVGPKLSALTAQ
ncbi:hypothetical protein VOLCADRAFT_101336, partial [Volvox carteri f. nagariensis]